MTENEIIEIIEMARQAGVDMSLGEHWSFFIEELEAFAKLVAAKAIKEALAQPTSGDYALGYSIGFGEGHSAGKALAQPKEQEPVAWMSEHRFDELRKGFPVMTTLTKQRAFEDDVAFYTTPPQRKPLTDEMLDDIYYCVEGGRNELETWRQQARAVEAAHGIKE